MYESGSVFTVIAKEDHLWKRMEVFERKIGGDCS